MKIGVSNLAWAPEVEESTLALLAAGGASGVEVAPTRIAPWEVLTHARLVAFRNSCSRVGLATPSLQAIFFARPSAQLLRDNAGFTAMCDHLRLVGKVARSLRSEIAVFGAPNSRTRGGVSETTAKPLAVERLRRLGDIAREHEIIIGMEPVAAQQGNDFCVHAHDLIALLREVNHPNVRFHMDSACVKLSGDDPVAVVLDAADLLVHCHASEPNLQSFDTPVCDHVAIGRALRQINYGGWVMVEMRQHRRAFIAEALRHVRTSYGET